MWTRILALTHRYRRQSTESWSLYTHIYTHALARTPPFMHYWRKYTICILITSVGCVSSYCRLYILILTAHTKFCSVIEVVFFYYARHLAFKYIVLYIIYRVGQSRWSSLEKSLLAGRDLEEGAGGFVLFLRHFHLNSQHGVDG